MRHTVLCAALAVVAAACQYGLEETPYPPAAAEGEGEGAAEGEGEVCLAAEQACDGLDEDCDDETDERPDLAAAGVVGVSCGPDEGECSPGIAECVEGTLVCQGARGPVEEVCNGLDDDCNGIADDGGPEVCNGLDDDCNGIADEEFPEAGQECDTGVPGTCAAGVTVCRQGALACEQTVFPAEVEVCNGLDEDCNGDTDDGAPCPEGLICQQGGCRCRHASLTLCAGRCVDLATDPEHCGECGHACGGDEGPVCAAGECRERCDDGLEDCGGACVDLATNVLHCAACDRPCDLLGAESACEGGVCTLTACRAGFVDLDGRDSNGCECVLTRGGQEACDGADNDCDGETDEGFDLEADPAHCGACGHACTPCHAAVECREGECVVLRCDEGFLDLDIDGANGCEYECTPAIPPREECNEVDDDCDGDTDEDFDLQADVAHCGQCGHACDLFGAEAECVEGACAVATCLDGFFDVDGEPASGCEVEHGEGGAACKEHE